MNEKHLILLWFADKGEEQCLLEYLRKHDLYCSGCESAKQFEELASQAVVIVMDLNIRETDAIIKCNEIKQRKSANLPFVIIVADHQEDFTHVTALDLGADDYITRPIKPALFLKRLEALVRRKSIGRARINEKKEGLYIDMERHLVFMGTKEFELPKKEFEMLNLFYSVPNKIFSREEIAVLLWKEESIARQRTIDVHVRNLRRRLGKDLIKTVKGFGYGLNKVSVA